MTVAPPSPSATLALAPAVPYAATRRALAPEITLRAELLSHALHRLARSPASAGPEEARRLEPLLAEIRRQIDALLPLAAPPAGPGPR